MNGEYLAKLKACCGVALYTKCDGKSAQGDMHARRVWSGKMQRALV